MHYRFNITYVHVNISKIYTLPRMQGKRVQWWCQAKTLYSLRAIGQIIDHLQPMDLGKKGMVKSTGKKGTNMYFFNFYNISDYLNSLYTAWWVKICLGYHIFVQGVP
jgi:hypothetical protein